MVANNKELMLKIYLKDGLGNPALEPRYVELVDESGLLTFIGNKAVATSVESNNTVYGAVADFSALRVESQVAPPYLFTIAARI